jgi:hypothetical protein
MTPLLPALASAAFIVPARTTAVIAALDSGWVELQYRKADGSIVVRTGTRNPTIVSVYGDRMGLAAIDQHRREYSDYADNILYWDYTKGGLRSFCRIDLIAAGIPEVPPEINH